MVKSLTPPSHYSCSTLRNILPIHTLFLKPPPPLHFFCSNNNLLYFYQILVTNALFHFPAPVIMVFVHIVICPLALDSYKFSELEIPIFFFFCLFFNLETSNFY